MKREERAGFPERGKREEREPRRENRMERGMGGKILRYGMGFAGLFAAVALAWFFPGWYSGWQDGRLAGQVTLQSRDDIQFLDTDVLDIASSMKMLKNYGENLLFDYALEYTEIDEQELISRWRRLVKQWDEAGLLPLGEVELDLEKMAEEAGCSVWLLNVYPESFQGKLRVAMIKTYDPLLTAVVDVEKDMIYYLSVAGTQEVYEWMAGELGYNTALELKIAFEKEGQVVSQGMLEAPRGDFASVCQALSWTWEPRQAQSVFTQNGGINGTAYLTYETQEAQAFRRIISDNGIPGVAVMYGTEHWLDRILTPMGDLDGFSLNEGSFQEWIDGITEDGGTVWTPQAWEKYDASQSQ